MIDWNHIWKQTLQASRDGRLENLCEKEEIAERYDRSEAIRRDGKMRADALEIDPSWSVLDIGAGPGTLALPLARRAKRVTAVEPSLAMVERLKRHIDEEGISNIRIISAPWEELSDEEVGRHDLVIASYSLVFLDIREALLKMDRLADREVHLYWFAGVPSWERVRSDLYPRIRGRKYVPSPMCDVLYNLLYNQGIYPDVQVLDGTSFPKVYESMEDGISSIRESLGLSNREHDDVIQGYLEGRVRREGSKAMLEDETTYVRISWETSNR
jgi:ubiquinone/menaquinone biosynthesis C-methylase UbiE